MSRDACRRGQNSLQEQDCSEVMFAIRGFAAFSSNNCDDTIPFRPEAIQGLREEFYDNSSGVTEEKACFFGGMRHATTRNAHV
jgi:hypothetical protein